MSLNKYGVLKGKVINTMLGSGDSPHYQIHIKDDEGVDYRIAVNIKSQAYPSEVLFMWERTLILTISPSCLRLSLVLHL